MHTQINHTACFTGHRPKDLPWGYDESKESCIRFKALLRATIEDMICEGYTHFITGMAEGVDTYAAEILLMLRDDMKEQITIEGAIPCKNQDALWSEHAKQRYKHILSKLDKLCYVQDDYTPACMHKRNDYMLSMSSLVISGYHGGHGGTSSTLKKARTQNKSIIILNPKTLDVQKLF